MILPASYRTGFAPRDGMSVLPGLLNSCVFNAMPLLGPTGLVLRDWSGRRNNGALTNMTADADWTRINGKYSLSFDGTDNYVLMDSGLPLTNAMAKTISAWITIRTSANTGQRIVYHSIGSVNFAMYYLGTGSASIGFALDGSTSGSLMTTGLVFSTLYHVVGVYSGSTTAIYVNGVNQSVGGSATSFSPANFTLGGRSDVSRYMDGTISEVQIFNRALLPSEIQTLSLRPGIIAEITSRRRNSTQVASTGNRRRRVLIGAG